MKNYKVGQKVEFKANDFDGTFTTTCIISEVGKGYAIAVETDEPSPLRLLIDADTDFQFTIL